jgi:hypothetical protein
MKTLPKQHGTKETGVYYKQIVDDKGKEINKVYVIRYMKHGKQKFKTIGKYSQGIRLAQCKAIRDKTLVAIAHGDDLQQITTKKEHATFKKLADWNDPYKVDSFLAS